MYDLVGKKVGYLTVIERKPKARWLCVCDCGKEKIIPTVRLNGVGKIIKSCGCKRYELRNKTNKINGFTPGKKKGGKEYNTKPA